MEEYTFHMEKLTIGNKGERRKSYCIVQEIAGSSFKYIGAIVVQLKLFYLKQIIFFIFFKAVMHSRIEGITRESTTVGQARAEAHDGK